MYSLDHWGNDWIIEEFSLNGMNETYPESRLRPSIEFWKILSISVRIAAIQDNTLSISFGPAIFRKKRTIIWS